MTGGLATLVALALKSPNTNPQTIALTFFSMAFTASAGFSINDYFDRESDAVIKPNRPIPAGDLSPSFAAATSAILFSAALIQAYLLNWTCFLIILIDSLLLILYSSFIKRVSGFASNILVGALIGTAFLYGEAAGYGKITTSSLSLYPVCLGSIGGNVLRDVLSMDGDRKVGYSTLPLKVGVRRSVEVASLFFILCVLLAPLPFILQVFGVGYLVLICLWSLLILYSSIRLLKSDTSLEAIRRNERLLTMSMILLIIALLVEVFI